MKITRAHHFCVGKTLLFSPITQLVLTQIQGSHISFKYVRHNYLRCPMMGEVCLET